MKIKIWLTILMLSILLFPVKGEANTSMTMKNLEQELTTYLNDPSLTPGTEGYRSFILNQLMFGQDQELMRQQNYSNLIVYMSGYINNLVLQENDFYEQTVQEIEAKQQEKKSLSQTTNNRLPSFVNANDVKAYAQKWWNHRNPEFPDFSKDGGNCVNYTSQLLLAGGINRISPTPIPDSAINIDPNYWYSYKKSDSPATYASSLSWINVGAFYNFWKESQEIIQPKNLNVQRDLEVGDVIQLQSNKGGVYYHSMVVIDKDASTVYLTGNTIDRKRMDIRDLKDTNIRTIKFTPRMSSERLPTTYWPEYGNYGFGAFNEVATATEDAIFNMIQATVLDDFYYQLIQSFNQLKLDKYVGSSVNQNITISTTAMDFSQTNTRFGLRYVNHREWNNVWRYQRNGNLGAGRHNRNENMAHFAWFPGHRIVTEDGSIEALITYRDENTVNVRLTRLTSGGSPEPIFRSDRRIILPIQFTVNRWNQFGTRVNDFSRLTYVNLLQQDTGPLAAWNLRNNLIY
ncbi:amidase domain-containing protein [Enterococcus mundtii]|uniref:amidase domain-containing protein n=1 Tax=Enterococcus mundtii TaxID=53346 RepID=UPI0032DF13C9